ncbi:unnamed protein product, partial [Mycena citricolor]
MLSTSLSAQSGGQGASLHSARQPTALTPVVTRKDGRQLALLGPLKLPRQTYRMTQRKVQAVPSRTARRS